MTINPQMIVPRVVSTLAAKNHPSSDKFQQKTKIHPWIKLKICVSNLTKFVSKLTKLLRYYRKCIELSRVATSVYSTITHCNNCGSTPTTPKPKIVAISPWARWANTESGGNFHCHAPFGTERKLLIVSRKNPEIC